MLAWHQAMIPASSAATPSRGTTQAFTVSPRRGSGAATMQTWAMAGWRSIIASTSAGQTLKPEALIMRLTRSTRKK